MTAINKIQDFLKYLILHGVSQKSLKYYKSDLVIFLAWAQDKKINQELIQEYINSIRLVTSTSTLNRRISTLKSFAAFMGFKKASTTWQDSILLKFESKPKIKNGLNKLFFSRPNWYKKYHSYPLATYIHIAILILFTSVSGYALYDQVFRTADNSLAFPTALTRPNRFLSFQGRLTSNVGNPITTATNVVFKLYDASSGGTNLWNSGTCSITPDQDGIFSTLLGSSCGAEIASSVFSENSAVWVGVTVSADAEATPRIQIATVAYALNSETLQGFPAGTGTSTIPYINSTGTLVLANASPKLQSTSGTFAVEGLAMTISTPNTSNGVVTINPDGVGTLDLTFEGAAPGLSANGFVNATNANITSGSLYSGTVASAASGYNFINFLSGVSPTSKFSVDSTGLTTVGADLYVSSGISLYNNAVTDDTVEAGKFCTGDGETNCVTDFNSLTAGSSYWTQATGVLYPTTATNDFAIGGTTLASSIFSIDESLGIFLFGGDQSANPTLRFEATDSDTADFGFNTSDAFYFSGANVGVGTTTPASSLQVTGGGTYLRTLTAPTIGAVTCDITGGTLVAGTYYYKVSTLDGNGIESIASSEASGTVASGTTGSCSVAWTDVTGFTSYRVYGSTTASQNQYWADTATPYLDTGSTGTIAYPSTTGVSQLTLGRVGIGSRFSASPLHVSSIASTSFQNVLTLDNPTNAGGSGTAVGLRFRTLAQPSDSYGKAGIAFENKAIGFGLGSLHFMVDSNGDSSNADIADAKMTINYLGSVGIGTTGPSALLDVAGTATVSGTFTVGNGTTNTIRSPYGPLVLQYKSGANAWQTALNIIDTSGDVELAGGSASTGCTIANSSGNLTCTGTISGSGITATALRWDQLTAPSTSLTLAMATNATTFNWTPTGALDAMTFNINNNGGSTTAQNGLVINNAVVGSFTDTATDSLLKLQQLDTTATGTTTVTDALLIDSAGNSGIVDAIHISNTVGNITNAIDIADTTGTIDKGIVLSGTFTTAGIDAGNSIITNIGNAGTDFNSSGGLTLAENLVVQGTTGLTFNTGAGGDITFALGEKIDNDVDGKIAITATTTDLSGNLEVTGGNILNSAGTANIIFSGTPITTANTLSASNWLIENTANVGHSALIVNQTKAGDLFTASASGTPKFVITNTGSVGIGIAIPASNLHLQGFTAPNSTTYSSHSFLTKNEYKEGASNLWRGLVTTSFKSSASADWSYTGVRLASSIASGSYAIDNQYNNLSWIDFGTSVYQGDIRFGTGNSATNERMRIDSTGNIGIGTTVPDAALEINHATGDSLRLTYNDSNGAATNYTDFAVSTTGDLNITSSGGDTNFLLSNISIGESKSLYFNSGGSNPSINFNSAAGTFNFLAGTLLFSFDDTIRIPRAQSIGAYYSTHTNGGTLATNFGNYISTTFTGMQINTTWDGVNNDEDLAFYTHNGGISAAERMRIDKDGNVGIGDTTPTEATLVVGSAGAGNIYATYATANTERLCWDAAGASLISDCTGTPGDYAEDYGTVDNTIEAGDIVTTDLNRSANEITVDNEIGSKAWVVKSTENYQNNIIGIISTNPNETIGQNFRSEENPRPVALNGRVPVKISNLSEAIKIGDPITASVDPGRGVKAVNEGKIVGTALENWDPNNPTDKILVFVNNSYHNPELAITDAGDLNIEYKNSDYRLTSKETLITKIGAFATASVAKLKAGIGSFKQVETNLISPVANADLIIDLQPDNSQTASELIIKGENDQMVTSFDAKGNATISGTLYADKIESERLDEIEALLAEVEGNQALFTEAINWESNTATESAEITDVIASNLFVTGNATVNSLFVAENLTAKSLDSIEGTLSLQSLAIAPIEIMAGKITIDTDGNALFTGNVKVAGNLELGGNFVIAETIDPSATNSATIIEGQINSNSTAGKAVLTANTTEIKIINPKVKLDSLIYVTPVSSTENKVLYVKSKEVGEFTIGFNEPIATDVEFNWWIIELKTLE